MISDQARELREALKLSERTPAYIDTGLSGKALDAYIAALSTVEDAARLIALPILERDGRLVEKIYSAIAARVPSPEVSRSMLQEIFAALETEGK